MSKTLQPKQPDELHPDIVEAMEVQIEKIANAEEKIETIQKHFSR